MEIPVNLPEDANIDQEQNTGLNEEHFKPHNISDRNNIAPMQAKGSKDNDPPRNEPLRINWILNTLIDASMETGNSPLQNWAQHVAGLKHQHPHLTDNDFKFFAGYEEQMLVKLQVKLNLLPPQVEELKILLDELHQRNSSG